MAQHVSKPVVAKAIYGLITFDSEGEGQCRESRSRL